ncbi:MAG TPA: hypothetical protein VHX38_00535 [Pseudonocardiaceae bacterium]|nr:hypothetical protein [Pseudonocardiaceae bacterium]
MSTTEVGRSGGSRTGEVTADAADDLTGEATENTTENVTGDTVTGDTAGPGEDTTSTDADLGGPLPRRVRALVDRVPLAGRIDWSRVVGAVLPMVLYLAVREVGLVLLNWLAARNDTTSTRALTSWDGQWFLAIAGHGYGGVPPGLADAFGRRSTDTPLAFFPGYPVAVRWLAAFPGVDVTSAALVLSAASGIACGYALMRIARQLPWVTRDRQVGLILVVLFAASPMAIVLSMAYSEALFCALVAWSLVGVLEGRWLLAGVACAAAGLVRVTAGALIVVVLVAAIIAIARGRDGWRPWVGGLLAPLGLLGYLGFVATRTDELTGWFAIQQQGWDSKFDGGIATVRFAVDVLATGRSVLEVATVAVLVVAIVLLVLCFRQRIGWPLIVYGALTLAMDLGSNGLMNSKARLLVPAFTLLIPMAVGLSKRRRGTMVAVLIGLIVASAWFGAYALTGWQYAI